MEPDGPVSVSVVIPTFRRAELLERCLAAVISQDLDPASYEVIVADDTADDATRSQVERWSARGRPRVKYVPVRSTRGPSGARNAGWRVAQGAVVAFTDDDCIPQPDWLRCGLLPFRQDDGVAVVTGRVVVPRPDPPRDYERDAAGLEGAEFVTANCFCRKEALESVGGFDERFETAWREDSDLQFRFLRRGFRIGRAADAVVVHPVRPAPWGVSLRQQRKIQFDALLYKKDPELYRQRIRPSPPWGYYGTVACLLLAAAAFSTGSYRLGGVAWALWAGLTARFAWRRLRGTSLAPSHVAEMVVTSALIPPVAVFWRLRGALRFRTLFL